MSFLITFLWSDSWQKAQIFLITYQLPPPPPPPQKKKRSTPPQKKKKKKNKQTNMELRKRLQSIIMITELRV